MLQPTNKNTILVVDDTPFHIDLLRELLDDNYHVMEALDGETALEMLTKSHQPDLILLDVRMPGLDGFELCKRLKAIPQIADIPVIFLTALDDMQDKTQAFALGAVDYLCKPFDPDEVISRVKTVIG